MNTLDEAGLFKLIVMKRPAPIPMQIHPGTLTFAALSFGIAGEDLLLRKIFKKRLLQKATGCYIDIGSASPTNGSNTYIFYLMGWRGLCVDANGEMASHWQTMRPEDKFVHAAVGEKKGNGFLFRHKRNPGMHCILDTETAPDGDFIATPERISMVRLEELFTEHVKDGSIQFLTMDIEGGELSALHSNDWRRWRPEVILMECHEFNFHDPYGESSVRYLVDIGYELTAKFGPNVIMCDRELAS